MFILNPSVSRPAFAAALGAYALAPRLADGQALTTLRATSAIDDAATPYLYAMESGLFKKNGFDASLERATSGAAAASAVIGGSFEFGKSSLISLLSAHARGLPIIAVAAAGDYDSAQPSSAIVARADSPLRTGADFNGKTVAVSAINDQFSLATRAWVDAHGGDASTVKLIEIPMSAAATAISSGRIDAAVLGQPFLRPALESKAIRAVGDPISALGSRHTDSVWFTTIAYTQKNPDIVNRFIRTIRDAAVYTNGHHAETAYLLAKFALMLPSDITKARMLQGTHLDPANIQVLIDAAAHYKIIPDRFDARELIYANAL